MLVSFSCRRTEDVTGCVACIVDESSAGAALVRGPHLVINIIEVHLDLIVRLHSHQMPPGFDAG